MKLLDLNEFPPEMRDKLDALLDQLSAVTEAIRIAEDERKRLRDELVETLTVAGAEPGDVLETSEHGLRVEFVQRVQRSLNRQSLLDLGVSRQLIDAATIERETDPYVILRRLNIDGD